MRGPLARSSLLLWLSLAVASPLFAAEPTAVPIDGEPFPAAIASLAEGRFSLAAADGVRTLPLADLVAWGARALPGQGAQILLVDGGLAVADVPALADDSLQLEGAAFAAQSLPIERVAAILFQPPADRVRRDLLADQLRIPAGETDRVLLENGDELAGTVISLGDRSLELSAAEGPRSIELARVVAVAFNPRLAARPPAGRWGTLVGLSDGSLLRAQSLVIQPADEGGAPLQAALTLAGGAAWSFPAAEIAHVQPLAGRAAYLSDLPVAGYKHVPFLTQDWPYRLDRAVTGGRLFAGGRPYAKGLGLHSTARLSYKLDRPYRRFQASIALDDSAAPGGSVRFRVFVDRDERFAGEVVRAGDPPLPISVDVTGGRTLSLIVDFAERGDERDYANWLDARLVE